MQRDYEVMLVYPTAETVDEKKLTEYIKKQSADTAKITSVQDFGKRRLAYPIRKQTEANYWLLTVSAASTSLSNLAKKLQTDETLLRFLVIKKEE